jgi:hypothetical protein
MKLTVAQQLYIRIFCTEFTQIDQEMWELQVEIYLHL